MEQPNTSPGKFAINYGVILGVIMILIGVVMYVTGMALEGKQWPQYLYYLIFPIVILYAINQFKKVNGNLLSLGEAIKVGLAIAVISGIIYGVYMIIFNYVIDPEFMTKMMDAAREKLMENPDMTEEMIEQSMSIAEKFMNPWIGITFWVAMSAIFGLIYSLIGGLIMKNEE